MKLCAFAPVLSLALLTALASGQTTEVNGVVDAVTVYRGQALVTRRVPIDGRTGSFEVVVSELPARLIPSSLHADSTAGLQVRSVRYRTRPVAQDVRADVRALDTKIAELTDRQLVLVRKGELIQEQRKYVESLQGFVAPTAQTELTRGVLNAETLEKLSGYILAQREELSGRELERGRDVAKVEEELRRTREELALLTSGSQRTVQEAVLLVYADGVKGDVKLHYLVEGATWDPSYTARADGQKLTLEYYAAIEQMSGEDWGDVAMTLSTATPSLMASAPRLESMKIALSQQVAEAQQLQAQSGYFFAKEELSKRQEQAQFRRNLSAAAPPGGPAGDMVIEERSRNDAALNTNAISMQVLDLVAGARDDDAGKGRHAGAAREGLSVTYALGNRTTLPSRADRQLVQIAAMPMKASFAKVATPVLTPYVYDEARMANDSQMVLLAGPMTAYSAGAFVGSSDIPTVLVGESFVVGLGIDSSLRASRELVERAEQVQGGNRIVDITYKLVIENFGTRPADVRLLDRLPLSAADQVRVTLVEGPELCKDPEYLKTQRKDNILRYDLKVDSAAGRPAEVTYKFRLEYDKQMNLSGM
ncbi:MAG: mucoidy inhibitor MuiA family protein [Phycisphaerales bacterium]